MSIWNEVVKITKKKKVTVFQLIDLLETSIVGIPAYRDAVRRNASVLVKSLKDKYGGEDTMVSKEDLEVASNLLKEAEAEEEKAPEVAPEEAPVEQALVEPQENTEAEADAEKSAMEIVNLKKEVASLREFVEKNKDVKDLKEMNDLLKGFIEAANVKAVQTDVSKEGVGDFSNIEVPHFDCVKEADFFGNIGKAAYAANPSFWRNGNIKRGG